MSDVEQAIAAYEATKAPSISRMPLAERRAILAMLDERFPHGEGLSTTLTTLVWMAAEEEHEEVFVWASELGLNEFGFAVYAYIIEAMDCWETFPVTAASFEALAAFFAAAQMFAAAVEEAREAQQRAISQAGDHVIASLMAARSEAAS